MKLYHFTIVENLWLISQRGLEPYAKDDNAFMTFGEPVGLADPPGDQRHDRRAR